MGKEQDTLVSSSIIDLPPIADLTDPRLPRAFNSWTQFRLNHAQQFKEIGTIHPAEVILLAKEFSSAISEAIGVGSEKSCPGSSLSEEKLASLTNIISGDGNKAIFMRHGEQSPPEWISSLTDPALQKIRMMRDPFNRHDLLTNNSLVDVFVTALALLHIQALTGKRTRIFSSENLRAKEAAYIISVVISGSELATLEGLNCISYKNELDQPPVTEEDLLTDLPSGMMPWNPRLVDKLCKKSKSGIGPSEAIISTIGGLLDYVDRENGNKLAIVLTHTQQIAEVLRVSGRLNDSSDRFPELTMIAVRKANELLVLRRGLLTERTSGLRAKNTRKVLESLGDGYEWYKIRREEYQTEQKIPFLVAPQPLRLSMPEGQEVLRIGRDVVDFMQAADELYRSENGVKELLDRGKPETFQQARQARYLFARPDLLITQRGFSICEIETSPFGLALAELLNRAYNMAGFDTMVENGVLSKFMTDNTPAQGTIAYSQKTASYAGQLQFLAKEVMSSKDRNWQAGWVDTLFGKENVNVYRAFYSYEGVSDLFVNNLVQNLLNSKGIVIPSFTPYMEEKALLALIWDKRWDLSLRKLLGGATFEHLRKVIPPTWVLGQEQYFVPGLPGGLSSSVELAGLSKSKRKFVLKKSGFSSGSSWAEGVTFLHEKSTEKARSLLSLASQDTQSLYILQEFDTSEERTMYYEKDPSTLDQIQGKIRLTPYFSMEKGNLIAIKATGCEKTNYIHASTGSINTAVGISA